jgi:hypothetical protein
VFEVSGRAVTANGTFDWHAAINDLAAIFYVVAREALEAMTNMDFASSYSQAMIESEKRMARAPTMGMALTQS